MIERLGIEKRRDTFLNKRTTRLMVCYTEFNVTLEDAVNARLMPVELEEH